MFGKSVSDLQSGIAVNDTFIQGTLKHVTGYTEFSSNPALQEGNFLALKMTAPAGATTTVEVVGGESGPVTLDEDMNIVLRIADKFSQSVRVITTLNDTTRTKTFKLNDLICETE